MIGLKNKTWCRRNESFRIACNGVLTEAPSNGMAESMGHVSDIITPVHAKCMYIISSLN